MLTVSGALALLYGADVGVTVALRGATVGGLVGSLFRRGWSVRPPGRECLAAVFALPLQTRSEWRTSPFTPFVSRKHGAWLSPQTSENENTYSGLR